jgi:hypothetical protein
VTYGNKTERACVTFPPQQMLPVLLRHPPLPPFGVWRRNGRGHPACFLGGLHARQNIVCSLVQEPEEAYAPGEDIALAIYATVVTSHRCTAEQMAILEPVLSETVLGTCLTIIGEAVD